MPSTSLRLGSELKRAIKGSRHSISELARGGLEQVAVDEYVSVCWVCGEAIYRGPGTMIDRMGFEEKIAGEPLEARSNWERREYHEFREQEQQGAPSTRDADYYDFIAAWLALPEWPVDFCEGCKEVLREISERSIEPTEIPVPFLFREREGRGRGATNWVRYDERPHPRISYAAQAAAVYWAEYLGFHLRDGKDGFWWVARDREYQLFPDAAPIWVEAALRSNAYRIGWGEPPIPVFRWSVEAANEMPAVSLSTEFDTHPPGLDDEDDGRNNCEACGTANQGRHEYCNVCFYASNTCSACGSDGAVSPTLVKKSGGGELLVDPGKYQERAQRDHPFPGGNWQEEDQSEAPSLREADLVLWCRDCGEIVSSDFYGEEASDLYRTIFEELEPLLPIKV